MRILLHARLTELIATCRDRFDRLGMAYDVAETLERGLQLMRDGTYDHIFVGYGVSASDRLAIVACAAERHQGVTEILDRDTIYRTLRIRSMSTAVPPP